MENEKRLIDANEAYEIARTSGYHNDFARSMADLTSLEEVLEDCTTVDAVEVDTIRAWLYEMAMNNTDNYLCNACEEIISRLDGLRLFAKMDGGNDDA